MKKTTVILIDIDGFSNQNPIPIPFNSNMQNPALKIRKIRSEKNFFP
jgi:hypothetical protein